jgi:hypothetical protein
MVTRTTRHARRRTLLAAAIATAALAAGAAPVMAAEVQGTGSDLQYSAAPGETNNLRITQTGLTVLFDDVVAVTTGNPACAAANGNVTCTALPAAVIDVQLEDLDDQTTLSGVSLPTNQSGSTGDDVLRGGDGNDNFFDEPGADTFAGGNGSDGVSYLAADAPLSVTLDGVANDGIAGEGDNVGVDVEDVYVDIPRPVTIVGSAAANVIYGYATADTIDGAAGNDVLFGANGNDTITARDGYADRVDCGSGTDAAVVDTLDIVAGCETVDRLDVGNANDEPEDQPPTIGFLAPAANGLVPASGASVTLAALDDRGVANVELFDDGAAVGVDGAAPFAIPYRPTGGDVGLNTLVAVATDTAGQTATAIRRVRVGRFAPRRVSLQVTPTRDRSAPYRFRVSGSVLRPPRVSAGQGCRAGIVVVTVKRAGRTVSSRRASLRRNCTFGAGVSGRAGSNRVTARFLGNEVFAARSSAVRAARGG